ACVHELRPRVESIPFDALEIRRDDEIALVPPGRLAAALHDLEASANDLNEITRRPQAGRRRQVDGDDVRRAELAREQGGNLHAHRAVHEQALARAHGLKETRVRAARANWKEHFAAVTVRDGVAGTEIG